MRIVGGRWAGVELTSPSGRVRPTAEALRDAWLTALEDDLRDGRLAQRDPHAVRAQREVLGPDRQRHALARSAAGRER